MVLLCIKQLFFSILLYVLQKYIYARHLLGEEGGGGESG